MGCYGFQGGRRQDAKGGSVVAKRSMQKKDQTKFTAD